MRCVSRESSAALSLGKQKERKEGRKKERKKKEIFFVNFDSDTEIPHARVRHCAGSPFRTKNSQVSQSRAKNKFMSAAIVERPHPLHCGMTASPPSSGMPPAPVAPVFVFVVVVFCVVRHRVSPYRRRLTPTRQFPRELHHSRHRVLGDDTLHAKRTSSCQECFFGKSRSGMGSESQEGSLNQLFAMDDRVVTSNPRCATPNAAAGYYDAVPGPVFSFAVFVFSQCRMTPCLLVAAPQHQQALSNG